MYRFKGIIPVTLVIVVLSATVVTLLAVPFVRSDDLSMTVDIDNVGPSVGTITCTPSSLTPTAGANTTVSCEATITDNNGYGDVDQNGMNATLFYDTYGVESADDLNVHYSNGTASDFGTACIFYSGSGVTIDVQCNFTTRYFIHPYIPSSNWTVNFSINDTGGVRASNTLDDYIVNPALGFNVVETTIDFSNLALGATSAEQTTTIDNLGNIDIDLNLSESASPTGFLDCPVGYGDIDIDGADGIRYNKTTSFTFAQGVALTASTATYDEFNHLYYNATGTTDGSTTQDLYWLLRIPASGSGGTCTGTATIIGTTNV